MPDRETKRIQRLELSIEKYLLLKFKSMSSRCFLLSSESLPSCWPWICPQFIHESGWSHPLLTKSLSATHAEELMFFLTLLPFPRDRSYDEEQGWNQKYMYNIMQGPYKEVMSKSSSSLLFTHFFLFTSSGCCISSRHLGCLLLLE